MPLQSSEWMLQFDTLYRGKIATSDQNLIFAPSATLYHLKLVAESALSDLQLRYWLGVDNLTDKNYVGAVVVNQANGRSFEPGIPRQWLAGLLGQSVDAPLVQAGDNRVFTGMQEVSMV